MATSSDPYFFEKYFPASYNVPFAAPMRGKTTIDVPKEELEERSYINKNEFHVLVDISDFLFKEVSVTTVDQTITVEAKQTPGRPGVVIPRHFIRHFKLPDYFDSEDVFTTIDSENGILEINAVPFFKKKFARMEELRAMADENENAKAK